MRIGVPKEIKDNENRVALTPSGAGRLVSTGHDVVVEHEAGAGCGFADADYVAAGARIGSVDDAWGRELVVKVKEPLESEYAFLSDQILFTYLHLAGAPEALTLALLHRGTTAVAYETVEDAAKRLPLLAPMSAIAGSMAPLVGVAHLARFNGGRGTLPTWILGRRNGRVMVVGDGVVGTHAARVAAGIGANVTVFGVDATRAEILQRAAGADVAYEISSPETLAAHLPEADLLIGAVLVEGARAPRVVSTAAVASMPDGAVIVDVSIDQGGCVETSRPTSHSAPTFVAHGVIHYCVTNMPGAFPRTSTVALTDATLPYVERIASDGVAAFKLDPGFGHGVNTYAGYITCEPVARSIGQMDRYRDLASLLD